MGFELKNTDEIKDSRDLYIKIVGGFRVRIFGKWVEWYPSVSCKTVAMLKDQVIKTLKAKDQIECTPDMLIVIHKDRPLEDT